MSDLVVERFRAKAEEAEAVGEREEAFMYRIAADEIERLRAERDAERAEVARLIRFAQLLLAERDASRLIISDLTAEAERLRAAGDTLAVYVRAAVGLHGDLAAIDAWQEARRG